MLPPPKYTADVLVFQETNPHRCGRDDRDHPISHFKFAITIVFELLTEVVAIKYGFHMRRRHWTIV